MSIDEREIEKGISAAVRERREIDDRTARIIGSQFHGGDGITYAFASTGAILCDPIARGAEESTSELWRLLFPDYTKLPRNERRWADWLGTYLVHRKDRGPVEGWGNLNW